MCMCMSMCMCMCMRMCMCMCKCMCICMVVCFYLSSWYCCYFYCYCYCLCTIQYTLLIYHIPFSYTIYHVLACAMFRHVLCVQGIPDLPIATKIFALVHLKMYASPTKKWWYNTPYRIIHNPRAQEFWIRINPTGRRAGRILMCVIYRSLLSWIWRVWLGLLCFCEMICVILTGKDIMTILVVYPVR